MCEFVVHLWIASRRLQVDRGPHDEEEFVGLHAAEMDVTGGIGLKVQRARSIAAHGIETLFVNGEVEGRLQAALMGHPVRGTRFPPAQKG